MCVEARCSHPHTCSGARGGARKGASNPGFAKEFGRGGGMSHPLPRPSFSISKIWHKLCIGLCPGYLHANFFSPTSACSRSVQVVLGPLNAAVDPPLRTCVYVVCCHSFCPVRESEGRFEPNTYAQGRSFCAAPREDLSDGPSGRTRRRREGRGTPDASCVT